uniref:Uncharacterized protein n=1 Tax=Sinocyclocheilus grahami TaxID=75366 RepID=A0A672PFJ8_SINGR
VGYIVLLYKSINWHLLLTHGGAMNIKYQIKFHQVNLRVPVFDLAGNWSGSNLSDCDPALVTKCIKKEKSNAEDDIMKFYKNSNEMIFWMILDLKNDPKQRPIRLPLYQSCNFLHFYLTASDNALKSAKAEQKYPVPVRGTSSCPQQPTVGELFQQLTVSDKEELLFIQLPDTIPGQPKPPSPEKPRKEGKTLDKRSSQIKALVSPCTPSPKFSYAFFRIRHPFLSKCLLRMRKHMTVLGNITHKLVCSPDFETLPQEAKLPSDPSLASKS